MLSGTTLIRDESSVPFHFEFFCTDRWPDGGVEDDPTKDWRSSVVSPAVTPMPSDGCDESSC